MAESSKKPKTIGAAKFKEQCLKLIDNIDQDGLIITKNGKPVARLVPFTTNRNQFIGQFADAVKVKGSTLTTGVRWNAES